MGKIWATSPNGFVGSRLPNHPRLPRVRRLRRPVGHRLCSHEPTSSPSGGGPMNERADGPGHATLEELRVYWRMPSLRATRELARALGIVKVGDRYPWLSIWAAEGLAPPPRRHWSALKL